MAEDSITGRMVLFILENLNKVSNMVKEDGKVEKVLNAISMKVIINMIKSMDMEYLFGKVEIVTKENIKKTKEMVKVK